MSAPNWIDERIATLRERGKELAAQLDKDEHEPVTEICLFKVTTTKLQIGLNEMHLTMLEGLKEAR